MLPEFRVLTKTAAIVTDTSSRVCGKVPPSPRRKREHGWRRSEASALLDNGSWRKEKLELLDLGHTTLRGRSFRYV